MQVRHCCHSSSGGCTIAAAAAVLLLLLPLPGWQPVVTDYITQPGAAAAQAAVG
jgi:hypothetical protein